MSGRLLSLWLLGLALIKTLLQRIWVRQDTVATFNRVYRADGVLSVKKEEARVLSQARGCIACGRCDLLEGPFVAESRVGYRGMMAFALSGARDLTRAVASADMIQEVSEERFVRAERDCPVEVPLLELARLVRGHAARLDGSSADQL